MRLTELEARAFVELRAPMTAEASRCRPRYMRAVAVVVATDMMRSHGISRISTLYRFDKDGPPGQRHIICMINRSLPSPLDFHPFPDGLLGCLLRARLFIQHGLVLRSMRNVAIHLHSQSQFRYGRHHLAKPHEKMQYPHIHHFAMTTNGTELFVSFQLEKPLAQRIPESGSFLDRGERHERFDDIAVEMQ
ncbi:hypothetical protein SeMB42_g07273, partial [Synchytrium endobioticum]